jgi:iron complex transport system substrate-binding protein
MPSEAGVIPALSRNGDASLLEDEPGRLACADDLSSEEGRLVPMPSPVSQRTHFVLQHRRRMMIMRARTRQLAALAAASVLALTGAACSSSPASTSTGSDPAGAAAAFPVTITSFAGKVRVPARPGAIVSLSPTVTEMLYAIGAGRQVKAVDDDSDYPKNAPITKLSGYQPNAEAIAAYQPSLVVISNNINGITAKLQALSIPVLDLPAAANVSQEYAEFDQLGTATGHLAQAKQEVAKLKSQIAGIVASVPSHPKAPITYYYEVYTDPYYSVTSSTFIGGLLSLLGMKSIADSATGAAASGGYPTLSAEFILKANPDYIILSDTGPTGGGQDAKTVSSRPGWSVLSAVKDKHIILLNPDIASRWGPRVPDLLQDVAAAMKSGS